MKSSPKITQFFQQKKIGAIEKAFLRQCENNEKEVNDTTQTENRCVVEKVVSVPEQNDKKCEESNTDWVKERVILDNSIKILQKNNTEIKAKYEKLKSKHIELLQTLQNVVQRNQDLETYIQALKLASKPSENDVDTVAGESVLKPNMGEPNFEIDTLADFVIIFY